MTRHAGERNMNRIFAMCILFYMTKILKPVCIALRYLFIIEQAFLMSAIYRCTSRYTLGEQVLSTDKVNPIA